ncbi:hypothetical protein WOSG25_290060 [Weissella oryzae SG25]|uniref:Uncharacterized protein n=1 Tax=Weissella oryzae (strain DSM 25784 / JCM 18191 / LMG 30913 / SG25) TaxID=1329250 RepID=A0A069CXI2_WEIOS|nr:hypothetical protein [Weissella oryzae]GAK32072.1 hypothetical protein WOSG25_290060 [Weissella oryzae SG25]
MRINELEKRDNFDDLVVLGHRFREALFEYQYVGSQLGDILNLHGREVGVVATQLANWYVQHDFRLPSEGVE